MCECKYKERTCRTNERLEREREKSAEFSAPLAWLRNTGNVRFQGGNEKMEVMGVQSWVDDIIGRQPQQQPCQKNYKNKTKINDRQEGIS